VGTPRIGKYNMIPSLVTISRSRHHKIYDLLASWWRQNLIMQKNDERKCWEYIIESKMAIDIMNVEKLVPGNM
jgi:hypothetical protein